MPTTQALPLRRIRISRRRASGDGDTRPTGTRNIGQYSLCLPEGNVGSAPLTAAE
jgi:hypothetical protein